MTATHEDTTRARTGSVAASLPARTVLLLSLFGAQALALAAATASGKIPPVVLNLFRAILAL